MQAYKVLSPTPLSDIIRVEWPDARVSREPAVLLAGSGAARTVGIGAVLGQILFGTPAVAEGANTGDGTVPDAGVAGGPVLAAGAKVGVYTLTCVTPATDAGTFSVVDPDGYRLPDAVGDVAYTSAQIGFTIGVGGTDYAAGDTITITVPAGSGKITAIDFSAVDGSQRAWGIAIADYEAADAVDGAVVAVVRNAIAIRAELVWPSGATAPQKAAAEAELEAAGIIIRDAV